MTRRLNLIVLVIVAAATIGGLLLLDPFSSLGGDDETDGVAVRDRAEIAMATLSITDEADGQLVFTDQRPVVALTPGTVTSLATVGTAIEPGTVLFGLDEAITVALPGQTPAWRTITIDDIGPDVAQLEAALVNLGFDPDGELTVDDTYTPKTAVVVEQWQADAGLAVTGSVELGSVVFVPDAARISSAEATVGQSISPGATVMVITSDHRELTATIPTDQRSTLRVGATVTARLPDRTTVDATIVDLVTSGDGSWLVSGRLAAPETPLPIGESVPITVSWTTVVAEEVPTVQAGSLSRLDTGAYVVEVVESGGTTRFVEVEVGATAGSTVELITDLPPGTTVISG